jgi:ATP-dependent helicase/nuclease subunit B
VRLIYEDTFCKGVLLTQLPSKTLHVFQTSRKLQKFLADNQNKLLHATSLSELFDKTALVEAKAKISKSARIVLLRKAAQKVEIERLGFSKSFLDFLSNSDFLFSFFEELRGEGRCIDDIRGEDIYAAFEDHLGVLEELFEAYKKELDTLGYYDFISVDEWLVNEDYLKNFDEIHIDSMGLFTVFELGILEKISQVVKTTLSFTLDRYNKKMAKKFEQFGIEIGNEEGVLSIDISAKKLISATPTNKTRSKISSFRLKNRVYEAPFALSKIADFLDEGCEPENIAVILPDESFAPLLKLFDRQNNLNFAFGEPLTKTPLFNAFDALLKYASDQKNAYKLSALGVGSLKDEFLALTNFGGFSHLQKVVLGLLELDIGTQSVKELFKKELHALGAESVIFEHLSSLEVGHILAASLASQKIDDTSGGRIKVIGVLESRGIELDGAIILDMNDDFFPKRLDKDLFLNTKIKEKAGMPTTEDRQNLQKHFFLELMANTKECVFAFVENDEQSPSPFLFELGLAHSDVDEDLLEKLYFSQEQKPKEEPIAYDDTKNFYEQYKEAHQKSKLSVSAFCDYLKCERFFYFKHIQKIYPDAVEEDEKLSIEIGNAIHKALELAFDPKNGHFFADTKALKEFVVDKARAYSHALSQRFEFDFALSQMESFFENEIERQREGFGVYAVEKPLTCDIGGVVFDARVDRIDKQGGKLHLIDYKVVSKEIKADSAKTAETSSKYQLCIYAVMLQKGGENIKRAYYYDVLRGKLTAEEAMDIKLSSLESHIQRFCDKPQFAFAKEKAACRYCDYAVICGVHVDNTDDDGADE